MLVATGRKLYYHTWPTERGNRNYEVDFLIPAQGKIDAIEVKSSSSKEHASIDAFIKKFSSRIRQPYLIHGKDLRKDGVLKCLPFYMAPFI